MLDRIGVIDIVIASHDRRFDYRKLQVAFDALWFNKRARPLTPTRTRTYLCPEDAATLAGAIEACAGARCEMNVGKPDPTMLETIVDRIGLDVADCVMTGDRFYTRGWGGRSTPCGGWGRNCAWPSTNCASGRNATSRYLG